MVEQRKSTKHPPIFDGVSIFWAPANRSDFVYLVPFGHAEEIPPHIGVGLVQNPWTGLRITTGEVIASVISMRAFVLEFSLSQQCMMKVWVAKVIWSSVLGMSTA